MADRTRATLGWHFERARSAPFVETPAGTPPDVVVLDADHADAGRTLDALQADAARTARPVPPVVLLAFGPPPASLARRAVHVVSKPVSAHALARAARVVRGEIPGEIPDAAPATAAASPASDRPTLADAATPTPTPPATPVRSAPAAPPRSGADPERARLRDEVLFGSGASIDAGPADHLRGGAAAALPYDPSLHVGALLERELTAGRDPARTGRHALTIEMPHMEIFVLPDADRVYASDTLGRLAMVQRTFGPLDPDDVRVVHHAGGAMTALLGRVRTTARSGYTLDAFTWLCALMSSHGRLPAQIDRARPVRLARWPNLTRLEPVPHAFELAARWSAAARSIEDMVRETDVEPRFVHAFHNAAAALALFETASGGDDG